MTRFSEFLDIDCFVRSSIFFLIYAWGKKQLKEATRITQLGTWARRGQTQNPTFPTWW